jgi:hypothetical protein
VSFKNCIIYGSLSTEISFQEEKSGSFNYSFNHSLIKIDPNFNTNSSSFNNINKNTDPLFIDHLNNDFKLSSLSPAKYTGNYQLTLDNNLLQDIEQKTRNNPPSMGAFEFED